MDGGMVIRWSNTTASPITDISLCLTPRRDIRFEHVSHRIIMCLTISKAKLNVTFTHLVCILHTHKRISSYTHTTCDCVCVLPKNCTNFSFHRILELMAFRMELYYYNSSTTQYYYYYMSWFVCVLSCVVCSIGIMEYNVRGSRVGETNEWVGEFECGVRRTTILLIPNYQHIFGVHSKLVSWIVWPPSIATVTLCYYTLTHTQHRLGEYCVRCRHPCLVARRRRWLCRQLHSKMKSFKSSICSLYYGYGIRYGTFTMLW